MDKPKGLYGEVLFAVERLEIGETPDATLPDHPMSTVRVSVLLERVEHPAQTVRHTTVDSYRTFNLTTELVHPDGISRHIPGTMFIRHLKEPFTRERLEELRDLVKYHLNAMHANCEHQGLRKDAAPCPETGYVFGSEWLVEPLPTDILPCLREIFEGVDPEKVYDSGEES